MTVIPLPTAPTWTLIYADELKAALAGAEACRLCDEGLGVLVEHGDLDDPGTWNVVQLHATPCPIRKDNQ